jgi:hypothetical protein
MRKEEAGRRIEEGQGRREEGDWRKHIKRRNEEEVS